MTVKAICPKCGFSLTYDYEGKAECNCGFKTQSNLVKKEYEKEKQENNQVISKLGTEIRVSGT